MPGPDGDRRVTVAVLGAGVSGICIAREVLLKAARSESPLKDASVVVFESNPGLGGTWFNNTYPAAACDIMSHFYSYSFALNPNWSEGWSPQAQIQAYLKRCADSFGVTPRVRFSHRVTSASWDDVAAEWVISVTDTANNSSSEWRAKFFVAGPGLLCLPSSVDVPGVDAFRAAGGLVWHSARWRHDVPLAGKRVAVIGTGASAGQVIPAIAPAVGSLLVVQRTPAWVAPRRNFKYSATSKFLFAWIPGLMWLYRLTLYLLQELRFWALINPSLGLGKGVSAIARKHLKKQVSDPTLREALTPHYPMGCKRVVISDDLYPALTRSNVSLVPSALTSFTSTGIVTADGKEHDVDVVIMCNGFDVSKSFPGVPFFGTRGVSLAERWAAASGPTAYLGVAVPDFPNLFLLLGPNSGLGHSSVITMIEAQAAYIIQCIERTAGAGPRASITVCKEPHDAYNAQLQADIAKRVWAGCKSWYNQQGIKNTAMWPHTVAYYSWRMRSPVWEHIEVQQQHHSALK